MKKLIAVALSLLLIGTIYSQEKKDVTLEDVWRDYKFYPRSVGGFRSMNDGVHYTTLEKSEVGSDIIKYAYANKKIEKVLVAGKDLKAGDKIITINDYEFSVDESNI